MDWASSVLGTAPEQAVQPPPQGAPAPAEVAPQAEAQAPKPEAAPKVDFAAQVFNLPQGTGDPAQPIKSGRDVGISGSFVTGLSSDENEAVRYLAQELYPNEPIEQAVKRFGKRGDVLFHRADDGNLYEALPEGMSPRAVVADFARGVAQGSPMIAGATAGMVTAPLATTGVGLAGSMAAAGGAAALTEAARQKLGDVLMGPASTNELDTSSVAMQGAQGALGQGIGAGVGALATRGAVRDIANLNPASTQRAYREAAREGIDLTPAEATGLPTLAAQQKRLTNITPTADRMRSFTERRNEQVIDAWGRMLDRISRASDAEDVGMLARETAEQALGDMRAALRTKAEPLYRAAYQKRLQVTPELQGLLKRPVVQDAIKEAESIAANEGVPLGGLESVRTWDFIKRGMDALLDSPKAQNPNTGGVTNFGRIVQSIKREVLKQVDSQVPEYARARQIYSTGAEDVTDAMQSALNIIAKTKDTNILAAARHAFNPRTRSPQMVVRLRNAIESKNPAAWQGLKRLYMQDVTTDALRITEAGDVANPAGKLVKAFTNPRVQANLRAAMSPQEWSNLQNLIVVMRRAASVPALRSDTEFNRLMSQEAEKAAQPVASKVIGAVKAMNPANPNFLGLQSLQDWMKDRNLTRHAERVVELITSGDPQALETMRELRRLSPRDRRWLSLFGQLVARVPSAASELVNEPDYAPNR